MERKILLVDDESGILKMLEKVFAKEGYVVLCAESAEEALEILGKEDVQVMFLDLKLPGMDGVDLCKQIREERAVAVIYAMTAYTSIYELVHCREAGFDDYFTKPIELNLFFKAADDAFEKIERWKGRRD
jgi:DNA-binding response OmpR family regulator